MYGVLRWIRSCNVLIMLSYNMFLLCSCWHKSIAVVLEYAEEIGEHKVSGIAQSNLIKRR
jgi:hypothetical protein